MQPINVGEYADQVMPSRQGTKTVLPRVGLSVPEVYDVSTFGSFPLQVNN